MLQQHPVAAACEPMPIMTEVQVATLSGPEEPTNLSHKDVFKIRTSFKTRPTAPINYLRASTAKIHSPNWYTANTNHFKMTDSFE